MRVAKRFTIQVRVCDELEGHMMEGSVRLTVVDPNGMDSDVGPLSTEQTLDFVERHGDGSGSSVWIQDEEEFRRCNDELERRATVVNAMVVSDPRLPFGGVKGSGYRRELARLREFVDVEAVSITERPENCASDRE